MRGLLFAAVLVLVIPSVAGAKGGEDVKALRALLQQQTTLIKQGEFRAMYALTTKRFRNRCRYARFVRNQRAVRTRLGPTVQVDRIQVRFLTARRAIVAYRFLKNGKPFVWVRFRQRDLYAKVGSRWYDEHDRIAC